jgi:hypothetical protein
MIVAIVNAVLSIIGLGMCVWAVHYFKSGILVKTFRRGQIAAVLLLIHFVVLAAASMRIIPHTGIDDIFGLAFMIALIYVTYGLINDWKHLGEK